ncbi:MAG: S49 family peptidase [Pseudomonadota bacterium]
MWPFSSKPVVPVLRLEGTIGRSSAFSRGLSLASVAGPLEKAFAMSKLPSVAIVINSPGGSPVQSNLIFNRIRQLATEKKKRVYVFCEDLAASGGYYIAVAGDEIYADPSSIVGSIGVIAATFGFDKAIDRVGIERRVYTAGNSKSTLDPFRPEKPEDVARIQSIQTEIHDTFIGVVKSRRGSKLEASDDDLFNGAFWAGPTAHKLGLIDGIADVRSKMREIHGEKIALKVVPMAKKSLLSRLSRSSSSMPHAEVDLEAIASNLAAGAANAIEERSLWARYGL